MEQNSEINEVIRYVIPLVTVFLGFAFSQVAFFISRNHEEKNEVRKRRKLAEREILKIIVLGGIGEIDHNEAQRKAKFVLAENYDVLDDTDLDLVVSCFGRDGAIDLSKIPDLKRRLSNE